MGRSALTSLAVVMTALLISGCAASPVLSIASTLVSGITYISSGKSLTDVAISGAVDSDCATLNILRGQPMCNTAALNPTSGLASELHRLQPAAGLAADGTATQVASRRTNSGNRQIFGTVRTVSIALPDDAQPEDRRSQFALAWTLSDVVRGCDDMARLALEMGQNAAAGHFLIETTRLRPAHLRSLVALPRGVMSPPIETAGRIHLFMRCDSLQVASRS
ncbi:MAG: hypothetical protein RIE31_03075 [Alphaproteobacteria bacterium]